MQTILTFIQRRPEVMYFVLAYSFAWAFTPLIVISPYYGIPGLFAPALAAILVTGITEGRAGVRRLLGSLSIWRVGLIWYVVPLGLPVFLSGLVALLGKVLRPELPVQLAPLTPLILVIFVFVVGEELGWRGYGQPQLEKNFPPLTAALILGILWGFWHLPNFFIPGTPHEGVPLPAFILYTTALSVLAAWLLHRSRGSVLIATLLHGATNTFGFLTPGLDTATRWWLIAGVYGLAALIIIARMNKYQLTSPLTAKTR